MTNGKPRHFDVVLVAIPNVEGVGDWLNFELLGNECAFDPHRSETNSLSAKWLAGQGRGILACSRPSRGQPRTADQVLRRNIGSYKLPQWLHTR